MRDYMLILKTFCQILHSTLNGLVLSNFNCATSFQVLIINAYKTSSLVDYP